MNDIASRIEHTVLGPTTTWDDVQTVLDTAEAYGMRACVPPCYVDRADSYAPELAVTTVVGFPHGQHSSETKCAEATNAWQDGAAELDVVCNVGQLRAGTDHVVREELTEVVAAVPVPVKVIVEAPLLTDDQLHRIGEIAVEADAAYLKTATGFSDGGATAEDVRLLSEYLPVKASGGIRSWSFAKELFDAGAERIGASSGDQILDEYRER
ncbi:deoxyribose-phosphate aldolase [Halovenus marina]|uniref:deoxyribose-phosphate aldolase n=1 Tax=Halovenus marina TaxID=3396621 RepID=UPI003F5556C7